MFTFPIKQTCNCPCCGNEWVDSFYISGTQEVFCPNCKQKVITVVL